VRCEPRSAAAADPCCKRDGDTITALDASSINDGSAASLVTSERPAAEFGLISRWVGGAVGSGEILAAV